MDPRTDWSITFRLVDTYRRRMCFESCVVVNYYRMVTIRGLRMRISSESTRPEVKPEVIINQPLQITSRIKQFHMTRYQQGRDHILSFNALQVLSCPWTVYGGPLSYSGRYDSNSICWASPVGIIRGLRNQMSHKTFLTILHFLLFWQDQNRLVWDFRPYR